ncbi:winged helix-turn-helix domain-containing tetratricopeptide repeat protein [Defluviimonas sp. SAOS-178_SWC]|uniref:winged helix-turn-helix domain-containing tetratricopeptide repeat protein n=1 Tax=Defluviimonas sp. SAOS-178_SWC TaxID=3121287 RepID=UPI0032216F8D
MQEARQPIRLAGFTLDPGRGVLERDGAPVEIRAKTFALLTHLATHRGAVVAKEDLMAAVWPGLFVSDDTLTQTIKDLRRVLGPAAQGLVRTFPRRGYMLDLGPPAAAETHEGPAIYELRLAVLPFEVEGEDGDDRLFRDLAEEVTYGLARYRTLAVISPYSALGLSPEGRNDVEADYVVRGRVRRLGGRYRISVDLTETAGARRLWGETFTLDQSEILSLEETLPRRIIQRVAITAEEAATDLPLSGRPADIQAFRHFVTARRLLREVGPGVNEAAVDHLREALRIDPDCAIALAYLALAEVIVAGYGSAPRDVLDRALANASRAVALAPEEARCHRMLGLVHQFRRENGAAEFHARRALELNPYDTDAMAQLSYALSNKGLGQEALALSHRAIELNPFHPMWYFLDLAVAAFTAGDYDLSVESLLRLGPRGPMRETRLAAALALSGRVEDAARHIAAAIALDPNWDPVEDAVQILEYVDPSDTERFVEGLLRALVVWKNDAREGPSAKK